jgi:GNAT superfamily N-acetyltransferase
VHAGDEEFLYQVYAGTRAEELAQVGWDDSQKELFLRQQFTAQGQWYTEQYGGASFDVVLLDGQPVGRLYVARWEEEIRIMDIALLPEHRGRGVGGGLLIRLMAEATAAGRPLTIHVERFNRALRLYGRLGFAAVEDKGVYLLLRWSPRVTAS